MLRMSGVCKRFGATQALQDVSLELSAGQVLALIGENGAGKSTLMKVLSGACRPDAGRMSLEGRPYDPVTPQDARSRGVAMIYQELIVAPDLSVEDNVMLGQERHRWGWLNRRAQRKLVHQTLDLLGHRELRPETRVGRLSVGAQQLVEIARALILDARLIVFDEPTSSLTKHDVGHLFGVIRMLRDQGRSMIYISHFLEEVREVCDSYTVLRDGRVAGGGEVSGSTDAHIVSLMVGREVDQLFPRVPHTPGEVLLTVEGLTGRPLPQDVSLQLRRGEIFGLFGLVGAGRTELLRCLLALESVQSGRIRIAAGSPAGRTRQPAAHPAARLQAGLGLVSEDRKAEGLAQGRSIADNMTLSRLNPYSYRGWLNLTARRQQVVRWLRALQVKATSPDQPIHQLSGGNQQKVAIARVLHQDADVLLLDEPTRGIDVGTKAEIYRLMGEQAAAGKAILFVSSYLPELLAVCDSVGIMARGRLREVRPPKQWTEQSALACAVRQ